MRCSVRRAVQGMRVCDGVSLGGNAPVAIEDSDGAFEELAKAVSELAKVVKSIKGGEK